MFPPGKEHQTLMSSQRTVVPHPVNNNGENEVAFTNFDCRSSPCSCIYSLQKDVEADLQQLEMKRMQEWIKDFGSPGFIQDLDADGHQTPSEVFDAADKRLNSLVSLGVLAGLLAGTAMSTMDLADNTLIGKTAYSLASISSICSISVAMLVSYHYFNGAKLMSLGHLTIEFFGIRTESFKVTCVRCFFLASFTQLFALALLLIGKLQVEVKTILLLESIPLLIALAAASALAVWIVIAMRQDREACK